MPIIFIISILLIWLYIIGYIFLFLFYRKLSHLEKRITLLFQTRTDSIPSIYEISKPYLTRPQEIFQESFDLRKQEFIIIENNTPLKWLIEVESHIHHEIVFIFKVCAKHPKLLKDWNFIYIREIVIQKSREISEYIELYKTMSERYNKYIQIKNMTLIWLLIPLQQKDLL